ncbi:MAG: hypothetical protein ACK5XN_33540, partial [Bacteroidota bacterium]
SSFGGAYSTMSAKYSSTYSLCITLVAGCLGLNLLYQNKLLPSYPKVRAAPLGLHSGGLCPDIASGQ